MFHLVQIVPGSEPVIVLGRDGKPRVYKTSRNAARIAEYLRHKTKTKIQPRRLDDTAWIARESARFVDGTYKAVPWALEKFVKHELMHFPHMSTVDDGMIAFTRSPADGAADRQTRMRPGRYLQEFYSTVLTNEEINSWACRFFNGQGVHFATTEDEIEWVYANGPSSCMTTGVFQWEHPSRCYAAGDLAIAWLKAQTASHASARAICWPEKKVYGRVYGDERRLVEALQGLKFRFDPSAFSGARLLRKPIPAHLHEVHSKWVIAPYLDVIGRFNITDTHLVLNSKGQYVCEAGKSRIGWVCTTCQSEFSTDPVLIRHSDRLGHEMIKYVLCPNCRRTEAKNIKHFLCGYSSMLWTIESLTIRDGHQYSRRYVGE